MFEVIQERYFPATGATRGYSDGGKVVATFEIEKSADDFIKTLQRQLSGDYYVSKREVKEVKEEKVSTRITAAEARQLAGPTVQERVDEVYPLIREAATQGKRSIKLHGWWANEGYGGSDEYTQACMILEGDGFKVDFFYEERQFVDMYTTVEW